MTGSLLFLQPNMAAICDLDLRVNVCVCVCARVRVWSPGGVEKSC